MSTAPHTPSVSPVPVLGAELSALAATVMATMFDSMTFRGIDDIVFDLDWEGCENAYHLLWRALHGEKDTPRHDAEAQTWQREETELAFQLGVALGRRVAGGRALTTSVPSLATLAETSVAAVLDRVTYGEFVALIQGSGRTRPYAALLETVHGVKVAPPLDADSQQWIVEETEIAFQLGVAFGKRIGGAR
jgi:hypothetical protein